jgi:hypothetical protein
MQSTVLFSRPEGTRQLAPRVHNEPFVTDSVLLGHTHGYDSDTAATLIHQTAMYAAHASNVAEITPDQKLKILPLGASSRHILPMPVGYSSNEVLTPAQVNNNRQWTFLRGNTVNMENSAEGYRVMAYLCRWHALSTAKGDKKAYKGCCPPSKKNAAPR